VKIRLLGAGVCPTTFKWHYGLFRSTAIDWRFVNLGTRIGLLFDKFGFTLNAKWPVLRFHRQKLKIRLFKKNTLTYSEGRGFWKLTDMPTQHELDMFYKEEFWNHRGNQDDTVNTRDLSHYFDLRAHASEVIDKRNTRVLNFGAGHGGLSHILWGLGAEIVNLDPSTPPISYSERWRSFSSESDLLESIGEGEEFFDIIYGSHSLEHVKDIDETLGFFAKISNSKTLFMFEVPDSLADGNGGKDGKVSPPHTYYFTFEFFESTFSEIIELTSIKSSVMFTHSGNLPGAKLLSGQGDSIRFIGRGLKVQKK
jgi:hypothetical protein